MKNLFLTLILLIISSLGLKAQNVVNNYKYILVPKQYEFQKEADSYQINSLTKFLFNKANFTALFTDEQFPADLATDRCKALTAIVRNNPSLLSTKITIDLVNCNNQVVFTTLEGKSKEKDYKVAYHQAVRNAFETIEALNYTYTPKPTSEVVEQKQEKPIEKVVETKIEFKKEEEKEQAVENKSVTKVNETLETAKKTAEVQQEKVEIEKDKKLEKSVKLEKVDKVEKPKKAEKADKPITKMAPNYTIEGSYFMGTFGKSQLVKKENYYALIGGDEKFEFALIYPTSKLNMYIIKWAAFKQPQLLELDNSGNLLIDSEKGRDIYKRAE
jgi:hypothetical protein